MLQSCCCWEMIRTHTYYICGGSCVSTIQKLQSSCGRRCALTWIPMCGAMFHCALFSGIHGSILRLWKSQKFVLTNSDLDHNLLDDDCGDCSIGNVTNMFCAWLRRIELLRVLLSWLLKLALQSNQNHRKQMHNRFLGETRHMTNTWPTGKIV